MAIGGRRSESNKVLEIREGRMDRFYRAALEIAERKLFVDETPSALLSPRLGTGGRFQDIFLWDTCFCAFWAQYHPERFPLEDSLDNFYRCQTPDGFINRQIRSDGKGKWDDRHPMAFAPPLLSWVELTLSEKGLFPGRLERVFPLLLCQHRCNRERFHKANGLYFSDQFGCGMDDIPRWDDPAETALPGGIPFTRRTVAVEGPLGDSFYRTLAELPGRHFNFGWNRQLDWIDTSAQVAFDALNLSLIAQKLGQSELAAELTAEHQTLKERINEFLWDERKGFYFDRLGDKLLSRRHIGAFWVLIAEVALPERAERLIRDLSNPETFGLPYGVPSLAKNDPDYDLLHGYWRGPVWCPAMYMLLCGLRKYGYGKLARELAEKFYTATLHVWEATGTVWENYLPELSDREPGRVSAPDFCGWSALAPVTFRRDFLD